MSLNEQNREPGLCYVKLSTWEAEQLEELVMTEVTRQIRLQEKEPHRAIAIHDTKVGLKAMLYKIMMARRGELRTQLGLS